MKTRRTSTSILATSFFLMHLVIPYSVSKGQIAQRESLIQKTVSVKMADVYAADVLEFLAKKYAIPCGIEIAPFPVRITTAKINIDLHQVSVQQVLDSIVEADTRYKWELTDGAINLVPREDTRGLLNITIRSFHIRNADRMKAKRAIAGLREVKAKLKSLGLQPGIVSLEQNSSKIDTLNLSITMRNTTLRKLLNEVAKKTGFWSVSTFGEFFLLQI